VKTRAVLGSIFASVAVLIVGWQAGDAVIASNTATTSEASGASGTSGTSGSTATTNDSTTGGATSGSATTTDGTYTGSSVSTRYGNVQVSVTVSGGAITDVTALQLTSAEGRSVQISNQAAPILRSEVIAAQSADVANVSGATFTSDAYLSSVQSALDQAAA